MLTGLVIVKFSSEFFFTKMAKLLYNKFAKSKTKEL